MRSAVRLARSIVIVLTRHVQFLFQDEGPPPVLHDQLGGWLGYLLVSGVALITGEN